MNKVLILAMAMVLTIQAAESQEYKIMETDASLDHLNTLDLINHIRKEKFDSILPQVMREQDVDMWIHVMREGGKYTFNDVGAGFYRELGDGTGVYIFTDRGGDHIERAVLGRRKPGDFNDKVLGPEIYMGQDPREILGDGEGFDDGPEEGSDEPQEDQRDNEEEDRGSFWDSFPDLIRESGAYDIVGEIFSPEEKPDPTTEYDHRFKGIGKFVAERNPKRIAVNYMDEYGPTVGADSNDGITHTDFRLLVKEIGEKYANRIVSSEKLEINYISRPVASELVMLKRIRNWIAASQERAFSKIIPGVTKTSEIEGEISSMDRGNERGDWEDGWNHVFQPGDFFIIDQGAEGEYDLRQYGSRWQYGNFFELVVQYGYILREGEKDVPAEIRKIWDDSQLIRKITADNIKVGRTGRENFEIIVQKLTEAGIYVNPVQEFRDDIDPEKTQVSIDLHALGKGRNAPRIGSIGPAWEHEIPIPENHHFMMEFFIYRAAKDGGRPHHIWFHDGALATKRGVEYLSPPPTQIRLIKSK